MKSSGRNWWHWWWKKEHPQPVVKHPPVTPPAPLPEPSWPFRDRPLVFTAWDFSQARSGPWDVATILVPGEAPVWHVAGDGSPGWTNFGVIWQAESHDQSYSALTAASAAINPRALVATQGGWEPSSPFLAAGINTVFVEAYQNDDPSHTPKQMVWQAEHDGWPYVIPVVGCYHGYPLASYDLAPYGKNFAVWLAEEMTDDDWKTLEVLAA